MSNKFARPELITRVKKSFLYPSMFYIQYRHCGMWKNFKAKRDQFISPARVPNGRDVDVVHFMGFDAAKKVADQFQTRYAIDKHNFLLTR